MIKIHHLNCGTASPPMGSFLQTHFNHLVCHCLLIEAKDQLILIDSGLGLKDIALTEDRMPKAFTQFAGPKLDVTETAIRQVEALGFHASDVRHIILTHLDFDHAGGIADFPNAKIHVFRSEYEAAVAFSFNPIHRMRYRPAQWNHGPHWRFYSEAGETWNHFKAVKNLEGVPSSILLIPLHGHTPGHCGVAVETPNGWYLHGGDSFFMHHEIHKPYSCPTPVNYFEQLLQTNGKDRISNQEKLRSLAANADNTKNEVKIFCAHDAAELKKFQRLQKPTLA